MRNIKISTRLILMVLISSAIITFLGLFGVSNLSKLDSNMSDVCDNSITTMSQIYELTDANVTDFIVILLKVKDDLIEHNEAIREIEKNDIYSEQCVAAIDKVAMDASELKAWNDWKKIHEKADVVQDKFIDILRLPDDSVSDRLIQDFVAKELFQMTDPFIEQSMDLFDTNVASANGLNLLGEQMYNDTKMYSYITIVFAILLSIFIAYFIISNINGSLKKANIAIQKLTDGDLTQKIVNPSKDEIGQLLSNISVFIERMKGIVENIVNGSDSIADASAAMASTSQEMSQGTQEQAASAEEISSSMEEMAANIQQNTDNAQQTEKIAMKAADDIKESSSAVNQTVDSMKKIADKIGIIGEIARQTNLLALNAAVEAARAGDHGKGFAVVAAEVRKLAERSQVAAEEINGLSSSSVSIADRSGRLLEQIVPNIQNTAKLVQEIAASSSEQSNGAEQVNNAIQQFNQVIQQNAAGAEEMASSSEELSSQADSLRELISFFKVEKQQRVVTHSVQPKKTTATAHNTIHVKAGTNGGTNKKGAIIDLDKHDHLDSEYKKF